MTKQHRRFGGLIETINSTPTHPSFTGINGGRPLEQGPIVAYDSEV